MCIRDRYSRLLSLIENSTVSGMLEVCLNHHVHLSVVITFLRILAATIPHQARGRENDVFGTFRLNPTNATMTSGDTKVHNVCTVYVHVHVCRGILT